MEVVKIAMAKSKQKNLPAAIPPKPEKPRKPEWEVVSSKISQRSWSDVRDKWLANPLLASTKGAISLDPAQSLPSLRTALDTYADDKMLVLPVEFDNILGLHSAMLLDGVYLLNKAVHVLSASQVHIDVGMCSWSLSNAYQSAFFAMKACAVFLGLAVAEIDGNVYVIDLCAESATQKKTSRYTPPKVIRVMKSQRIEHRQFWGLFGRLLRICDIPVDLLPEDLRSSMIDLGITDFATQRNLLHYENTSWIMNDLQQLVIQEGFASNKSEIRSGQALDVDRSDFSVSLAIVLVGFGVNLLRDIAVISNALAEELNVLTAWIRSAPNGRYINTYPEHAA